MRDRYRALTSDQKMYCLYALLFMIIVYVHYQQQMGTGDDVWFYEQAHLHGASGIFPLVWTMYGEWSSRLIINLTLFFLMFLPKVVWIVIDSFMFLLIIHSIQKLCFRESKKGAILKCLLIPLCMTMIPFASLHETGWYATTLNYIWPLALGLYILTKMDSLYDGYKLNLSGKVCVSAALLYAAGQEQVLALLFGVALVYMGVFKYQKRKIPKLLIGILIFLAGMLIFHLTCPGNGIRAVKEMATYYKEYADFTGVEKAALGFFVAVRFFFLDNKATNLFLGSLAVLVILNRKRSIDVLLAIGMLLSSIVLTLDGIRGQIPFVRDVANDVLAWGQTVPVIILNERKSITTFLFGVGMIIIIAYLVFSYADKQAFKVMVIILAAISTKMMMGFTPTVYISGPRTMIVAGYLTVTAILIITEKIIDMDIIRDLRVLKREGRKTVTGTI